MASKYSFLVIKSPKRETADTALGVLKQLGREDVVKLRDAVAITKTDKGKIKLHQTKDDSVGKGFVKVASSASCSPPCSDRWAGLRSARRPAGSSRASTEASRTSCSRSWVRRLRTSRRSPSCGRGRLAEAFERMRAGVRGQLVISEIVAEDLAEVEKLLEDPKTVESVPEELELPGSGRAGGCRRRRGRIRGRHAGRGDRGHRVIQRREARRDRHQDHGRPADGRSEAERTRARGQDDGHQR